MRNLKKSVAKFGSDSSSRMGLLLGLMGLIGAAIIVCSTPWGIGVTDDSVFYLSSAENLLAGRGLSWPLGGDELKPLTHYPPMYPLALASIGLLGIDLAQGARILAAVVFGVTIAILGGMIYRFTASWRVGLAVAITALVSPILVDVHLMALSEPIFLLLLSLTIAFLAEHLCGSGSKYLIASGVAAGLACLTRYTGLSILATGFIALLMLGKGRLRRKFGEAGIFAALGLMPLIIWYFRNYLLTGSVTNRALLYHPLEYPKLQQAAYTLTTWFLPPSVPFRLRLFVFLVLVTVPTGSLAWRFLRKARDDQMGSRPVLNDFRLAFLLVIFILAYESLLFFSLTFLDASTRLDARILSPAYVATLVLIAIPFGLGWPKSVHWRTVSHLAVGIWLVIIISYSASSLDTFSIARSVGLGFNAKDWRLSQTVASVQDLADGGILYSTEALPLYFLTGRPAYWVPEKINPIESRAVEDYETKMALMRERLKQPQSALIIFDRSFVRAELPPREEVVAGLIKLKDTADGAIYIDPVNAAGSKGE